MPPELIPLEVTFNYDLEAFAVKQQKAIASAFMLPLINTAYGEGETIRLEFTETTDGSIRNFVLRWQRMINRDISWEYERSTKWRYANWRRLKREKRKFLKAFDRETRRLLSEFSK